MRGIAAVLGVAVFAWSLSGAAQDPAKKAEAI